MFYTLFGTEDLNTTNPDVVEIWETFAISHPLYKTHGTRFSEYILHLQACNGKQWIISYFGSGEWALAVADNYNNYCQQTTFSPLGAHCAIFKYLNAIAISFQKRNEFGTRVEYKSKNIILQTSMRTVKVTLRFPLEHFGFFSHFARIFHVNRPLMGTMKCNKSFHGAFMCVCAQRFM